MWMDLEIVILNEVSQTEKDKCYDTTYTSNLKTGTNRLIYKQKQIHRYRNQTQGYHGGRWGQNKLGDWDRHIHTDAAAAAKSLQLCPTLCDPIDGSPPGTPIPGILQARIPEWVAISFSNA